MKTESLSLATTAHDTTLRVGSCRRTIAITITTPPVPRRNRPMFIRHLIPTATTVIRSSAKTASYSQQLFYARRPAPSPPITSQTATNGGRSSSSSNNTAMPRPIPPPTPGSSSDIRGKDGQSGAPAFDLPPSGFQEQDRLSNSSGTPSANGSDSSYRPVSPPSPNDHGARKRSAQGPVITKDDFALPPPPTRSRKIIQMKPREIDTAQPSPQETPSADQVSPAIAGRTPSSTGPGHGKAKKGSDKTQTAAGRKMARKTAHSLIERRRRSKMNEEFGVLKDMIPACRGQEMHKLAILQASIDYLRYLEQCVSDLQAQNSSPRPRPPARRRNAEDEDEDEEMEDDNDHEPEGTSTPLTTGLDRTNSLVSLPSLSQITTNQTNSPSLFATGAGRHYSISSASQASYSPYPHSNMTSPAFGPQLSHMPSASLPAYSHFGLGSPALKPVDGSLKPVDGPLKPVDGSAQSLRQIAEGATQLNETRRIQSRGRASHHAKGDRTEQELDQEAAAALSMLNHDRRNWGGADPGSQSTSGPVAETATRNGSAAGGMSVRDLLSG
ncbi:transcriptional regulator [Teratosphaeria destructans]|uniref:Transcriptional regulator n=1 Tax=Teratosphaeria destructans TaxID=418781 RepID=A0A9W7SWV8_9PEZI|nr:transcriptional regulator [Teratosphaeria destructans]